MAYTFLQRLASLVILGFALSLPAIAQTPSWQWVVSATSQDPTKSVTAMRVATDAAGNSYVAGEATGAFTMGGISVALPPPTPLPPAGIAAPTTRFAYVAKLDAGGAVQWITATGGPRTRVHSLAVDQAGNTYLLGKFYTAVRFGSIPIEATFASHAPTDDNYLAKLDPQGQWVWAKQVVGLNSVTRPVYMAADAAGNLTLTGTGYATFDNNAVSVNPGGIFVAHCTTDGVFDWAVGSSAGTAAAIAIDANGDAVVTGSFPVGGATFGSETLTSAGGRDIFLVKVEGTTGAWLGAIGAGGPGTDEGKAIALAPSGDVVVAANVQGTTSLGAALSQDMMVAHADGGLSGWQGAWSVGSTVARPTAISIGAGGEEILAFSANQAPAFLGTPLPWQGGFDGYLGATGGATPWSFDVGGVANDSIYAVRALGTGNAIVVGATASPSVALGPLTLSNSGPGAMAFVARLGSPLGLAAGLGTQAFQIWPNPASQVVNLRLPTATPPVSAVELLDGLGRIVRTQSVTTTATTFNLRGVPAGVYTLRSGSLAQRLVVQVP